MKYTSRFRLMYHFAWMPKYRHKVFSDAYRESPLPAADWNISGVESCGHKAIL
ncbi:MAG TPA: hypothetical protein VIM85_05930 [Pseudomonadales bacterium]